MTKLNLLVALALVFGFADKTLAEDAHAVKPPKQMKWSWDGPFGQFDRQQLQRGYQVYKEVCASCHSMHLVSFRNLSQPGGPEFSEAQMKAIAAGVQINTLDDKGEAFDDKGVALQRPGTAADRFPSPFSNELAARAANNNAYPPDLSVITKARPDGSNYVYSLLTGYSDPPAKFELLPGLYYNAHFPNHQIAMPQPLATDDQVTYAPNAGNPAATIDQMAKDVTAFLTWAGEPKMEERKQMGVKVIIFLVLLAALLYTAYRQLWKDVDH
ncbi:MAG: cytochrome c1 [Alphaproteobacteria bacterium]|nr:cytochrome c1 [Alphaproteobacteria bacterium]